MKGRRRNKQRIILGITGSFGSGKSTVAKIFKSLGAKLIDADKIAHLIIRPQAKCYKKIVRVFGKDILKKDKTIDRRKLAEVVFNNKSLLKVLNKIIHPQAIQIIRKEIEAPPYKFVVLDAPLLIEAGLAKSVDKLIVVKIDKREQIRRILSRGCLTRSQIFKRIRSQMPLSRKLRLADFVIDNSATLKETKKQVKEIAKRLSLASDS